jgi:hypothetical protein
MESTSFSSNRQEKTAETDGFLVPALGISIAIAIFAVLTQSLDATGAISLSTTQQLTMWLVAIGLIDLLWIAYMICRAYVTARAGRAEAEQAGAAALEANEGRTEALAALAVAEQKAKDAQKQLDQLQHHGAGPGAAGPFPPAPSPNGSAGEDEDAWVPPDELRYLDGSEHSVSTTKVFPGGCYLEPDPITPSVDKLTGQQVYQCRVVDLNPALKDRPHETVVKIPAGRMPVPPSMPRFSWVDFDDLTITSYMVDRSPMRIRYSLCATGIHPAAATAGRDPAKWTVPGNGAVTSGKVGAHDITEAASRGAAETS